MFLKTLTIRNKENQLIREVHFKKGMNIILGISSHDNKSTNNLGKTTLIRCIDFCLDGKIDAIYIDPEFKTENETVKSFLLRNKPTFSLTLARDFDKGPTFSIERTVDLSLQRGKVKNKIDGEKYTNIEFTKKLKELIFTFNDDKPTFRQIIGKFLRTNDYQISQILRFNSPYCRDEEYEKIHLFLLGFTSSELLTKKARVELEVSRIEKILSALRGRHSRNSLEQKLHILNDEVKSLEEQRNSFKINEKYEEESKTLERSQMKIRQLDIRLADINLKIHIDQNRIEKLEEDRVSLNSSSLKYLYEEAGYYTKKLSRTFDELVSFHNTMVNNEIQYLKKKSIKLEQEVVELEKQKSEQIETYNNTLSFLGRSGSLAEYTILNDKIHSLSEEIGSVNTLLTELIYHEDLVKALREEEDELNRGMETEIKDIDNNLRIFNGYFAAYSQKLDGEKYLLAYKVTDDGLYKFTVDNLHGNTGSGHKQSIVAAFDLAYMSFCNEINAQRPLFSTMDKVEIIDIEKLKILFELANQQNGQFIAPFISDKLESLYSEIEGDVILSLEEDDRFFRIEHN